MLSPEDVQLLRESLEETRELKAIDQAPIKRFAPPYVKLLPEIHLHSTASIQEVFHTDWEIQTESSGFKAKIEELNQKRKECIDKFAKLPKRRAHLPQIKLC